MDQLCCTLTTGVVQRDIYNRLPVIDISKISITGKISVRYYCFTEPLCKKLINK